MEVEVILFGQLTDIAGNNSMLLQGVSNTDELVAAVHKRYPAMAAVQYVIAVDKKTVRENTVLNQANSVALLPAFSGG